MQIANTVQVPSLWLSFAPNICACVTNSKAVLNHPHNVDIYCTRDLIHSIAIFKNNIMTQDPKTSLCNTWNNDVGKNVRELRQ